MAEQSYEMGFQHGWESVAGKEPMTVSVTYPPEGKPGAYHAGFLYGRAEALIHFKPGSSDHPEATGL